VTPIQIIATIQGAISMPHTPLAIDGILAWAVWAQSGLPPVQVSGQLHPIEIPVQRSGCGRFHLASFAQFEVEQHENRWVNRRFPVPEAQMFGVDKFRRVNITAGAQKSYRLPLDTVHLVVDMLTWWAVGDADAIRDLLGVVHYLGKKRSTGGGKVACWSVEECEPWEGFPVVRNGRPLRTLPHDWPGLDDPATAYATLTYPYWDHTREELCAVI